MGNTYFAKGEYICKPNGEKLYVLQEPAYYNDKFYIVKAKDYETNTMRLIKFVEKDDSQFKMNNLKREGRFRFNFPFIEHVYGNFEGIDPEGRRIYGVAVEFVEGCDLEEYRADLQKKLDFGEINQRDFEITIFKQILQLLHAVDYYYQFARLPFLHRDLKPQNVMITRDGNVKLVDFDFSHISGSTKTINEREWNVSFSAGYTSPEIFDTDNNVHNIYTEIYSAGRLIFYWLNGRNYYTDEQMTMTDGVKTTVYCIDPVLRYGFRPNINRFERKYLSQEYHDLYLILEKMCASPEECRYASVKEVLTEFEEFLLKFCEESRQEFNNNFGGSNLNLLYENSWNDRRRPGKMVAYRIGDGFKRGKLLYENTMRTIEVDSNARIIISNLNGRISFIPIGQSKLYINGSVVGKDYSLHDNDVITCNGVDIVFSIEE